MNSTGGKETTLPEIRAVLDRLYEATGAEAFFERPHLNIASAADPWFSKFKSVIGTFHWTPGEALRLKEADRTAKSVLVWVLPVRKTIREANRKETAIPAVSWAAMRSFGELANENIGKQLCTLLEYRGYAAVAPHTEQTKRGFKVGDLNLNSHWSERHAGFVAGLGTFGMSAGLITEYGIAHRLGSVVTDLELPVSERPYGDDPWGWCTHCGACRKRCPAGAVGDSPEERDKMKCALYARDQIIPGREERYGWTGLNLGCGLCQTGVPCEYKRP